MLKNNPLDFCPLIIETLPQLGQYFAPVKAIFCPSEGK